MGRRIACAVALILLSCTSAAPRTDEEYIRGFLDAWLIQGSIERAQAFLSPRFALTKSQQTAEAFPDWMHPLSEPQRVLTFTLQCGGTSVRCGSLDQCLRRTPSSEAMFEREEIRVTDDLVDEFPAVLELKGQEVESVALHLRACNMSVLILMDEAKTTGRIRSVMYLAL